MAAGSVPVWRGGAGSVCVCRAQSGLAVPDPCVRVPAGSRDSSPVMRSSSTLPVPQPSSAPPTPTRLTGPNSDTEEEERGDLIQFYNNVYIEQIKDFALKYTSNAVSDILCFSLVNRALASHHALSLHYKILIWPSTTTQFEILVHWYGIVCVAKACCSEP